MEEDSGDTSSTTTYSTYDETPRFIAEEKEDGEAENIRVVCRFRPENDQEKREGEKFISFKDDQTVAAHKGSIYDEELFEFQYSRIFPDYSSTADVFRYIANPLVDDVLSGFNGCVMAYGQTGSGKTYSMLGPGFEDARNDSKVSSILGGHARGIIPRIMEAIFDKASNESAEYITRFAACYIEIYRETLFDLLAPVERNVPSSPKKLSKIDPKTRLTIQESAAKGLWIRHAKEVVIHAPEDVMRLMTHGNQNRMVAATKQNQESSRSHAIFIVTINRYNVERMTTTVSQLHLADLAGSERVDIGQQAELRTALESETRVSEAKKINTSLFALGRVIHALSTGGKHISFRDSKLTRILQNSLGGNSKTTLLIHCSPSSFNKEETLSTLRFGEKTKSIKNKPTAREQLDAEELLKLLNKTKEEVSRQRSYISKLENELVRTQIFLANPTFSPNNIIPSTIPASDIQNNNNNIPFHNTTSQSTTDINSNPTNTNNDSINSDTTSINGNGVTPHVTSINGTPPRPNTAIVPALQSIMPVEFPSSLVSPRTPRTPQTPNVIKPVIKRPLQQLTTYETLHFMCPLTGKLFEDPVFAADGYTYERAAILKYFKHSKKSPVTRAEFASQTLIPNYTLLRQLQNIKPRLIHKQVPFFDLLPHWVLTEVLSRLKIPCLLRVSEVNKNFYKMANNPHIWTRLAESLKIHPTPDPALTPKELYKASYKKEKGNLPKTRTESQQGVTFDVHLVVSRT